MLLYVRFLWVRHRGKESLFSRYYWRSLCGSCSVENEWGVLPLRRNTLIVLRGIG